MKSFDDFLEWLSDDDYEAILKIKDIAPPEIVPAELVSNISLTQLLLVLQLYHEWLSEPTPE